MTTHRVINHKMIENHNLQQCFVYYWPSAEFSRLFRYDVVKNGQFHSIMHRGVSFTGQSVTWNNVKPEFYAKLRRSLISVMV